MAFADLLEQVGGVGRFQIISVLLLSLPVLFLANHNLLQNFTAAIPKHHCRLLPIDDANASWVAGSVKLEKVFIPLDRSYQPERCLQYTKPQWWLLESNFTVTNTTEMDTEPCKEGWTYDRSEFSSTVITEWDLVCGQKTMKQMGQSIYMAGVLVGAIVFGSLSDRFGRRTILIWSHMQLAVMGVCAAFSYNFVSYCVFRFMSGMAISGIGLNTVCLVVEWIPTRVRAITVTFTGYFYTFGQIFLAGLAYAIRDWRLLQLIVSLPSFIFFLYSWWLPESARWLILTKKPEQAVRMLKKVAKINRRHEEGEKLTTEVLKSSMQKEVAASEFTYTAADLVRTAVIRRISFCLSLAWFSTSFSYYGLAMDLQSFGDNIYLIQVIFGAVDFPAKLIATTVMCYIGRRITMNASLGLASLAILANIFVPKDMQILRTSLAVFGKGCLASSFTCVFLYTTELYPTVIRQSGQGLGQTMARVGGIVAPIVKMTSEYVSSLPLIIYGAAPLVSSIVTCFLPETKDQPLPETIEEVEERNQLHKVQKIEENVDIPMFKNAC
ncbi:solute carrier family 22 member 6-A [Microcaecilia unicolor]|uniref:Solute carrier family 22 member 6-A-like n=1 Tax=Microcaecilia unicolor TaxID=1415580 RepID=A0A6P7ZD01_9AMPH|nr:solute carrier family 22 member 6-A-like [Microcaecilia unicolor]XP_030073485.1 solute carrier family 22 member 6-A-like [Microcaecilia unicolor]